MTGELSRILNILCSVALGVGIANAILCLIGILAQRDENDRED